MRDNENPTLDGGQQSVPQDFTSGFLRVAFAFAVCFFLASHTLPVLVLVTLHSLLLIAAFGSVLVAGLRLENPWAPVLTRWDEALMLMFMSFVALKFVDVEAVRMTLEKIAENASLGAASHGS